METNEKQPVDLPENAFRELKPGEEYKPILSPEKVYPEHYCPKKFSQT